jgi:hypothetical protein
MLRRVRTFLVVALAFVLFLGLAGCGSSGGGSAKSDYEHGAAAILPPLQGDILKLRFSLEQARSPAIARAMLARIEGKVRAGITGLDRLTPPTEIAADHASLLSGYRALLSEFRSLSTLARRPSTNALRIRAGQLSSSPALRNVAHALQTIIAKGYDLGFPPGS